MIFGRTPSALPDIPASLDEAADRLRLRVYGADQSGIDRLEAVNAGAEAGMSALQQVSPDLAIGAVVEVSAGDMKVSERTLQSWGVSLDRIVEVGRDRARGRQFEASSLGGDTIVIQDEISAGALWVMPQMATSLPLQGDPIAWGITASITLITGDQDPQGMAVAADVIEQVMPSERVESITPHRLTNLGWEPIPWRPTPDHSSERIQRVFRAALYQRQAEPLTEYFRSHRRELFLPEHVPVVKPDGHPWSVGSWTESVEAALPITDEVVLVRSDGATVGLPWDALYAQAHSLLEPADLRPERYITRGFPTDAMIKAALHQD